MGGKMSRSKGQRGEREIINLLQPAINTVYRSFGLEPPLLQRNQMQTHRGGYDIIGLEWFAPEVKWQETLQPSAWWKQTVAQAGSRQEPVLFYKKNHAKWRVRMFGRPPIIAGSEEEEQVLVMDITLEAFIVYLVNRCRAALALESKV